MWLALSVSCYFISTCLLNRDYLLQIRLLAVHNRFHRLGLVASFIQTFTFQWRTGVSSFILYTWTDKRWVCVLYIFLVIMVIFHKAFCIPMFTIWLLVMGIKPKVPVAALTINYLAVISQWAHRSHLGNSTSAYHMWSLDDSCLAVSYISTNQLLYFSTARYIAIIFSIFTGCLLYLGVQSLSKKGRK